MKRRKGVVLLLALLCVVALELTAVGLHFAALQQLRAARSASRFLQLRLSAQSAAAAGARAWPRAAASAVPVGGALELAAAHGRSELHGIEFGASAERLGQDLYLIRAHAASPAGDIARIGYLITAPDPAALLSGATVRTGGGVSLGDGSTLSGAGVACGLTDVPPAIQLPDPASLSRAVGAQLAGSVEIVAQLRDAPLETLLPLPLQPLLDAARTIPSSTMRPAPVIDGGNCATTVDTNWGEPDTGGAAEPCAVWFPALHRPGDLALTGGRGQGILIVNGDLAMSGGATFAGLILVSGRVLLTDGASIRGAVISSGGVSSYHAYLNGDHCVVAAALAAVPGLADPVGLAGRRWIPLF